MATALIVTLAGAMFLGQSAPPPAGPAPTKLAVVNIIQLFDSLDERADGEAAIRALKDSYTNEVNKRQDQLKELNAQLSGSPMFKPGSDEYRKLQDDVLQKSYDLKAYTQMSQDKLFMEQRMRTAALYRKMNDAIAAYSQANGIALVFAADDLDLASANSQQELQAMVTVRKLLYFHPGFNITKYIIEKMNTEYKLGGRK
jgi:Skp family chaperone for outer membrane proteins